MSVATPSSRIRAAVDAGEPLNDVLIIDGLTGVGNEETLISMLQVMGRLGIDKACVCGNNDLVLDMARRYPERLIAMHHVNPNYPAEVLPDLERSFRGGAQMIKVASAAHQTYYPIAGANFRPAWEFAAAHRWPVLIHSGPRTEVDVRLCGPYEIGKVAPWYPDANFIISHCGAYDAKETWEALEEAIEMALRYDNVYLNFNTLGRYYGVVDYLVQRVGVDKVIFGSDGPGHCFAAEIGHVAYAKISDADKEKILGLNMARLLDLTV